MPDVPKHAWTHRPRSEGGTDPLEIAGFEPSWAVAQQSGITLSKASAYYTATFQDLGTNDTDCFEFETPGSSSSVYVSIKKPGYYLGQFSMYISDSSPYWGANLAELLPIYKAGSTGVDLANDYYFLSDFYPFLHAANTHLAGDQDHQGLYQSLAFHWNPGGDSPLDLEDPLNIGLRVSTALTGDQTMGAQMVLIRIATPGYTSVSLV